MKPYRTIKLDIDTTTRINQKSCNKEGLDSYKGFLNIISSEMLVAIDKAINHAITEAIESNMPYPISNDFLDNRLAEISRNADEYIRSRRESTKKFIERREPKQGT